jgi:hypothetical protein
MDKADSASPNAANPSGRLEITWRRISELKLDPRNPRAHRLPQIRRIARSIEKFGFNVPVLVDSNGKVIAGHRSGGSASCA